DFEAALRAALRASEMSAGLVNAGVLPALLAAGYTRSLADGPPSAALMQGQPPARLPEVLDVGRRRARVRPGAVIDLGGIARGGMRARSRRLLASVPGPWPRPPCCSVLASRAPTALLMRGRGGWRGGTTTEPSLWVRARVAGLSSSAALAIALRTGIALRTAV